MSWISNPGGAAIPTDLVKTDPATAAVNTIQPTADIIPLTVKWKAGQSANLVQFLTDTGTVLGYMDINGGLTTQYGSVNAHAVDGSWTRIGAIGGGAEGGIMVNGDTEMHRAAAGVWQGDLLKWKVGNVQTTVGAAGGASAPPATPKRYLKVVDSDGTTLVVPAYLAS